MVDGGEKRVKTPGILSGIDEVDIYVGERLRKRRRLLGLSQKVVGNHVGVSFQQIQKYEKGTNRIGASRLYKLADFLDVDVFYFFDGVEMQLDPEKKALDYTKRMKNAETQELLHIYYAIADPRIRRKVIAIAKLMS